MHTNSYNNTYTLHFHKAIVKKIEKDKLNGTLKMSVVGRLTKGHSFGVSDTYSIPYALYVILNFHSE